ncbi:hypothetical protein L596_014941 [Steinernema carpocapsae]|uniref:Potassium channel inwardly rectifying transmembrane domain-containing protein n=1 Tax=Steinernema carpocapsae TaxID=34508 RepID=A0A4U5NEP6_STECR|nr:hypothetical protein L596_014941 [Steinernema carpocapsae]
MPTEASFLASAFDLYVLVLIVEDKSFFGLRGLPEILGMFIACLGLIGTRVCLSSNTGFVVTQSESGSLGSSVRATLSSTTSAVLAFFLIFLPVASFPLRLLLTGGLFGNRKIVKINGHTSQRFWVSPVARNDDAGSLLVTTQGPPKAKSVSRARLVTKDGDCKLRQIHLPNRYKNLYKKRVIVDSRNWFHLIIESSWRCILAIFALGFLASWSTFAVLYYAIVYMSGDLQKNPENRQCIANVHSFVSAFLFR